MRKTFGIERGSFLHHFDSGGVHHVRRAFHGKRLAFLPCFNPAGISKSFGFQPALLKRGLSTDQRACAFPAPPLALLFGGGATYAVFSDSHDPLNLNEGPGR
jgi:hypothetical protein